MSRAVLSIGSNLGDRLGYLQGAVDALRPWLIACSHVYETPAWGPVEQPNFLNAALIVDDPQAEPRAWLDRGHAVEQAAERTREVHWGPRTLDVDVITVTIDGVDVRSDDAELTLPHPRAAERAFVLIPWVEIDPEARLDGKLVSGVLSRLDDAEFEGVRRRADLPLIVGVIGDAGGVGDGGR